MISFDILMRLTVIKETNSWSCLWGHFSIRFTELGRLSLNVGGTTLYTEKADCMQRRHPADNQHSSLFFSDCEWVQCDQMHQPPVPMLAPLWWTVMLSYASRQIPPILNCICQMFCHRTWKVTDTRYIKTTSFYQPKKMEFRMQSNLYIVTCPILSLPPSSLDSPLPAHFIACHLFHVMPSLQQRKAMHSQLIIHRYQASSSECRDVELHN